MQSPYRTIPVRETESVVKDLAERDVKKIWSSSSVYKQENKAQKSEGNTARWPVWIRIRIRIRIFCLLRSVLSTAPYPSSHFRFC